MLMNLRNALMAGKRLPYDAEVEYLESTGTQWIDTGYVPKIGDSVRMMFRLTRQPTSSPYDQIMGAGTGVYQFCFPTGLPDGGNTGIWCRIWQGGAGYSASFLRSNSIGPDYITDFRIEHLSGSNYRLSIGADYIDSEARSEIDGSTEQRNLLIFRRPNVGNSWIKCYAFQLWDTNGVLVRDFIPVRRGTVGYLYDRVTRRLFGNAGTGDFVLGPDVVPVEYIESHRDGYIGTGIVVNSLASPRLIAGIYVGNVGSNTYPVGGDGNGGNERFSIGVLTNKRLELRIGNYYNLTVEEGWYTVELDGSDGNGYVDGVLKYTSSTYANLRNNTSPIYFGRNAATGALHPGKIRCLQIFDGNTIVRSFRPVRVGTDATSWEGAMMDVLTRRIYRNAGTGAFTYGNDLRYPIPKE